MAPDSNAINIFIIVYLSLKVTDQCNRNDCGADKNQSGDKRALGASGETANPVATGAAVAHSGAKAYQQSRYDK